MQFYLMKLLSYLFISMITFSSALNAAEEIDTVAIVVNDSVITKRDISNRLNDFKRQIKLQGQRLPPEDLIMKQIVERMIVDKIQLQTAKAQGIYIDDLSLNKILEDNASKNKTTLAAMRRSLEQGGISYQSYREQMRNDLIIRQLQQRMIFSRVKVSQQEIDIFLDQQKKSGETTNEKYQLAHILIATPEAASPEEVNAALEEASSILDKIKAGEAFNELALNYSDGRNALKGGDLGLRSAAQLPPLFLDTARTLKTGEVSKPLRSAGGFHILKLIDKETTQHLVKQTHARHILIKADEIVTDDEAHKKITSIRKLLDKGADFAELAIKHSQDPGSKNQGGDLGWAPEGTFVARFTEVLNSLKVDEISKPFKTQFGWHIIQLLGHRQQDETEQVIRKRAEVAIQNRKAEEELQLWLRQTRDEAYVEYLEKH